MITTAKDNLKKFEENLEKNDNFLTRKVRCEYTVNKDITLDNFYTSDNVDIMLLGENMTICGIPTEEEKETLISFAKFLGIKEIETDISDFNIGHKNTLYLMKYIGDNQIKNNDIKKNINIYEFSKFCCKNFDDISFDMVYSYFARKVNKGISNIYYLEKDGKILSGAVATDYGGKIYLTFVSTDKEWRKNGLAKTIINHIISENEDMIVGLLCEKKLIPFYNNLNFYNSGEIYLYRI